MGDAASPGGGAAEDAVPPQPREAKAWAKEIKKADERGKRIGVGMLWAAGSVKDCGRKLAGFPPQRRGESARRAGSSTNAYAAIDTTTSTPRYGQKSGAESHI